MNRATCTVLAGSVLLAALSEILPSQAATIVAPGSNLLQTDPNSTTFFSFPFEGVPLGSFDFSGTIGVQDVGSTDIIVRRIAEASVVGPGNSATVPTVVDAFQMRSVEEVSILGGPLGVYYITLQSLRGGPISTGTMSIQFEPEGDPHGTFSSSFNLYVDVRLGSLVGPILDSRLIPIPDSGQNPWRHEPTGPVQIPGVNVNLNGVDSDNDFWIVGSVSKETPNGIIAARNAIPEPAMGFALFGVVAVGLAVARRRS